MTIELDSKPLAAQQIWNSPQLAVIVPSYKEHDNIAPLYDKVTAALGDIPLRTPQGVRPSDAGLVLLRPEQIGVRRDPDGAGVVTGSQYFGHDRLVEVSWPGVPDPIRARLDGALDLAVGDRVDAVVTGTGLAFPPR